MFQIGVNKMFSIGIDIGGMSIKIGVVDKNGKIDYYNIEFKLMEDTSGNY